MIKSMFAFIVLFCSYSPVWALLQWETTHVTNRVSPTTLSVDAIFRFRNIGDSQVTVTEVKPSCGCTTAKLEKVIYSPGEGGEIKATFNIGSRQGLQSKTISVATDDAEDRITVLTMKTLIPKLVEIKPGFVYWSKGDAPDPKSATVIIDLDEPVHIVAAESNHSSMVAQLEEIEAGRRYRLEIFPLTTDDAFRATIALKTDYPKLIPRYFMYTRTSNDASAIGMGKWKHA